MVVVGFASSILAVWAEPQLQTYSFWTHVCHYIARPGLVIAVDWLHIDFWQHPASAFILGMAFDALIYGALFCVLLELARFILTWRKSQGKISN